MVLPVPLASREREETGERWDTKGERVSRGRKANLVEMEFRALTVDLVYPVHQDLQDL